MTHKTGFTTAARRAMASAGVVAATLCSTPAVTRAQQPDPTVYDTNLAVRAVASGLNQPVGIAFLGSDSYFIVEKASGQVKWVRPVGGVQTTTVVLDLPVNSFSERGLLSVALHPDFPANPGVYLFWTESSTSADSAVAANVGNPNSPYPRNAQSVRQPYRPLRVERLVARIRPEPVGDPFVPGRSDAAPARQPQRRRHQVRQ